MKLFEVTSDSIPSALTIHLIDITEYISTIKHRKVRLLLFDSKSTSRLQNKLLFMSLTFLEIQSHFLNKKRLITELFTITHNYHFSLIKINSYLIFTVLKLVDRQKCQPITFLFTLSSICQPYHSEARINRNSSCRTKIE